MDRHLERGHRILSNNPNRVRDEGEGSDLKAAKIRVNSCRFVVTASSGLSGTTGLTHR
jgi:hypothetical protein